LEFLAQTFNTVLKDMYQEFVSKLVDIFSFYAVENIGSPQSKSFLAQVLRQKAAPYFIAYSEISSKLAYKTS